MQHPNAMRNAKTPSNVIIHSVSCTFPYTLNLYLVSLLRDRVALGNTHGIVMNLVDEVDNHVVFLDPHAVEVFARREREVILALAAGLSFADHRGRVQADAVAL